MNLTRFKQGWYLRKEYIKVEGLPYSFAQISDLHFDNTGKFPQWIKDAVIDYFHGNPIDVLAVTGDLIDGKNSDVKEALEFLIKIPVNYVVVSLGNHDEPLLDEFFELAPNYPKIKMTVNGHFVYNGINFISMADYKSPYYQPGLKAVRNAISDSEFNVVLAHNPHSFWDLLKMKKELYIISGHTHGGQILWADALRSIFKLFISNGKLLNTLRINHSDDCFKIQGNYNLGRCKLHINNGLGSHPPGRFFCPPTITIYK